MPTFQVGDTVRLVTKRDFDSVGLQGHQIQVGDVVRVTRLHYDHYIYIDMPSSPRDKKDTNWAMPVVNFELFVPTQAAMPAMPEPALPTIRELFESLSKIPDPKLHPLEASKQLGGILADLDDALNHIPALPTTPAAPAPPVVVTLENAVIGRSVARGPDWQYGDNQDIGQGIIVKIQPDGWLEGGGKYQDRVSVQWGDGYKYGYRIGPRNHDLVYAD